MSVITRAGRGLMLTALLSAWAWYALAQNEGRRAWLGVWVGNLAYTEGAFVASVDPRGPAAAAIRGGDVIVAVDPETVRNMAELTCLLQRRKPGETIKLALLRGGARHTVEATLGRWPDKAPPPRGDCGDAISGKTGPPAA